MCIRATLQIDVLYKKIKPIFTEHFTYIYSFNLHENVLLYYCSHFKVKNRAQKGLYKFTHLGSGIVILNPSLSDSKYLCP